MNDIVHNIEEKNLHVAGPGNISHLIPVREGSKVVEFGSGDGKLALELAKNYNCDIEVFCIDVQKDLLNKLLTDARDSDLQCIKGIAGDVEDLEGSGMPPGSSDIVVIVNTLYQFDNLKNVFKEAMRILKKGGKLFIVEWNREARDLIGPPREMRISKDELSSLLTSMGFVLERSADISDEQFMLQCVK